MDNASEANSSQLGLLDLSVDLSVPEVYAGTDFTLYLHVNNPFGQRLWIRSVELSLPTQLRWRPVTREARPEHSSPAIDKIEDRMRYRSETISKLENQISGLPEDDTQRGALQRKVHDLQMQQQVDRDALKAMRGGIFVAISGNAQLLLEESVAKNMNLDMSDGSVVTVRNATVGYDDVERVPLRGTLPEGAALEPGCTDVWTIRLGSNRSPFFIPAQYRLQLTVIYTLNPLIKSNSAEPASIPLFSNTTTVIVPVKAALWSIILGGVLGGAIGSIGRSLQNGKTLDLLVGNQLGASVGSLLLSLILSGAAIIFSARKSDAQTFVTVEDFWGGILIGFLIGYSGTAAFDEFTKTGEESRLGSLSSATATA
ncbi:hypothetical protein ACIBK9_25470 [Nonomuraea sp. NPDC050227]|uniref:hypothetical protein n=1 Tax=Nonomuraea sp. NPDC050227 TaxID=3364360 RepID=UPI003792AA53